MNNTFKPLNIEEEAVSLLNPSDKILISYPMFKISQFISSVKCILRTNGNNKVFEQWFEEGINCEILKFGARSWQTGKVRIKISLEFCSDEPEIVEVPTNNLEIDEVESPLDDIRQMMNGNS